MRLLWLHSNSRGLGSANVLFADGEWHGHRSGGAAKGVRRGARVAGVGRIHIAAHTRPA